MTEQSDKKNFMANAFAHWYKSFHLSEDDAQRDLNVWREKSYHVLTRIGMVIALFVYIAGLYYHFPEKQYSSIIVYSLFYILGALITYTNFIPFKTRSLLASFIFFGVGVYVILYVGVAASGFCWLFAFTLLAGIFHSISLALVGLLLNIGFLAIVGMIGLGELCHLPITDQVPLPIWINVSINFIVLNVLTTIGLAIVLRGFELTIKSNEKELVTLNEEKQKLEHTTSQLFSEKERQNQEANDKEQLDKQLRQSQKMEAIGTLAGGIAHDFNNILAAIIGFTELAMIRVGDNEKAKISMQKVLDAGDRAKNLVAQLLSFSRQAEKKQRPIVLTPIIKETMKLLRSSLPSTIEIVQRYDIENELVNADPIQIHQLVMNLCMNAHKAMEESGGVLTVSLTKEMVTEEMVQKVPELHPGPYIKLTIKDTGHGIPSEIIGKIFEPYFTTAAQGDGSGLGLAVVHGIIKGHKGAITVSSEPDQGATFEIHLPMISNKKSSESSMPAEPHPTGSGNILFVDDEQTLVDMGKEMLEHLGYTVTVKMSSIEVLDEIKNNPTGYDAVITDMTMPKLPGDKLAQEILKINPEMPIILCTGFSDTQTEQKARAVGVKGFLLKPLVMKDLAHKIKDVLNG